MSVDKLDLAQLMLARINEEPELKKYLQVSEDATDLTSIPLANLFFHLDQYYNKAATIKSALQFLTESVGLNKKRCILVIAVSNLDLYQAVASMVAQETEGYYVARAHNLKEADLLVNFFSLNTWMCGLIVETHLYGEPCLPLLEKCKASLSRLQALPVCVIGQSLETSDYVNYLARGAQVIIDQRTPSNIFEAHLRGALLDMFLDDSNLT